MAVISRVPDDAIGGLQGKGEMAQVKFPTWWMSWFQQAYLILFAQQQSGSTANRPTGTVWIGRTYYDVTLQKPVYVASVNPIVWKDATGSVV